MQVTRQLHVGNTSLEENRPVPLSYDQAGDLLNQHINSLQASMIRVLTAASSSHQIPESVYSMKIKLQAGYEKKIQLIALNKCKQQKNKKNKEVIDIQASKSYN